MASNPEPPDSALWKLPLAVFMVAVLKMKLNRQQIQVLDIWLKKHNERITDAAFSVAARSHREGSQN